VKVLRFQGIALFSEKTLCEFEVPMGVPYKPNAVAHPPQEYWVRDCESIKDVNYRRPDVLLGSRGFGEGALHEWNLR
jgi:hypothetical protein